MAREKIKKLTEMLKTGSYTINELIEGSGAKKTTIMLHIKYVYKKQGLNIVTEDKNGELAYSIK